MFKFSEANMKCSDTIRLLSRYQDNELDETPKKKVKDHLQNCSNCRSQFSTLESISRGIVNLREEIPDKNFTQLVMSEVFKRREKNMIGPLSYVYAVVFALFFILGIFMGPFSGKTSGGNINITDLSSIILQGQKFTKAEHQNSIILQLPGGEDEKRID